MPSLTTAELKAAFEKAQREDWNRMKEEFHYKKNQFVALRYSSGSYPGTERIVQFKSFKGCKNGPPIMVAMHEGIPKSYTLANIIEHCLANKGKEDCPDEYDIARENGEPASTATSRAPSSDEEEGQVDNPLQEIHELKQAYEDTKSAATTKFRADYDGKHMPALQRQIAKKRQQAIKYHEAIIQELSNKM
jgi:hypothetical protein